MSFKKTNLLTAANDGYTSDERDIIITSASTGSSGGDVLINLGWGESVGGEFNVTAGNGGTTGVGGDVFITSGAGGSTSGDAGDVNIIANNATSGIGGDINLTPGTGDIEGTVFINGDGYVENDLTINNMLTVNGDGYIENDFTVNGKLTVNGLIDPIGLVLNEQSTSPNVNDSDEGMVWVRDDGYLIFTDQSNIDHTIDFDSVSGIPFVTVQEITNSGSAGSPISVTDTLNTHVRVDTATIGADSFISLPPGSIGKQVRVKDKSGAADDNPIQVTPDSGTIDGQANHLIGTQYGGVMFICVEVSPDVWDVV